MSKGRPRPFSEKVGQGRQLISELMQKIAQQRKFIANLEIDGKDARQARHFLKAMLLELEKMLAGQRRVMMGEYNVAPGA
jgi:hypothetical protein